MRKLALVPLLFAACGDDSPVRHLDGGIDSPIVMPDTPVVTDPVTLTVTNAGQPQANVKVYFLNPDSSVVANATTDATGVASAVMPMGGSVTAINPFTTPQGGVTYDLTTFNGVKPGDHLKLTVPDFGTTTDATVTVPEDTTAGVVNYLFRTPCANGSTGLVASGTNPSTTLSLDGTCGTATDFLVISLDDAGQIVHYIYVPNETVATTIDFTNKTWVAPATRDYTFNNTTGIGDAFTSIDDFFSSTKGELANVNLVSTSQTPPLTYTGAAPGFTNAIEVVDLGASKGGLGQHHVVHWGAFATTALAVDIDANTLIDITADPAVDTTAHTIAWTEGATGLTPDFAMAFVFSSRNSPVMSWSWQIVGPHTEAALHFPTLPTDVADFTIGATDTSSVQFMIELKGPLGYDGIRANVFDIFNNAGSGPPAGLFGNNATGTLGAEAWEPQQPQRPVTRHPWNLNKLSQLVQTKTRAFAPKAPKTTLSGRHR